MSGDYTDALSLFGRVRRVYWVVLAATLVLAMAVPAATLWHAAGSALRLRASVWPAAPHVGDSVHVLVVPLNDSDGSATEGSWARLVVSWDMVEMAMHTQPVSVPGRLEGSTFAVPLRVDMAGLWQVDVTLQTPGRPSWHTLLHVVVLPSASTGAATTDYAVGSTSTLNTCGRADTGRQST